MRYCENCGSQLSDDARSCDYCGQKVNIKTRAAEDKNHVPRQNEPAHTPVPEKKGQPLTSPREVEAGQYLPPSGPSSPVLPTKPGGFANKPGAVISALLLVAVVSALVLGGVIGVNALSHSSTSHSRATPTLAQRTTPTASQQPSPTPSPVQKPSPTTPPTPTVIVTPPVIKISPTSFNQTSCPQNNDASWTCTVTVIETSGSQNVNWSATSKFSDVSFTPAHGPVSVGTPANVSIAIPATDCQNGSFSFNFTGGVQSISTKWSCAFVGEPTLGTCSYTAGQGWICPATLSSNVSNGSNMYWSTSSSGVNGISFDPPNGIVSAGNTAQIRVSIPDTVCPTSATLTFYVGGALYTNFTWSCPAPTLAVTPNSIGPKDCTSLQNGSYQCTVTLSDDQGGAKWTASSDIGATFSPNGDTVYPGGEKVTITVGCGSGTFTFTGPGNAVTVSWGCIF